MAGKVLEWTLGLRNHASGKYLTQETFGFAVNANGSTLKKKQTLALQTSEDGVHIRTHLGRYVYGTSDGKLLGDAESPNKDTVWTIEPQADGTWALKSAHGFYANGSGDNLSCFTKELPPTGKWVVHLAMHPQVNVMNVMRKRFVHLEDGELHCNEDVPWGEDALLTFVFFDDHPEGRYGFMACNGKYLNANGSLQDEPNEKCQFLLGFHDEQVSLRDADGNYLSAVGAKGTLKVNKSKITKDELFVVQDSEPQFTIKDSKGRWMSIRSSAEVKADQSSITDLERFQLELTEEGKGSFKTSKSTYWSVQGDGTVAATAKDKGPNEQFTIEFLGNRVRFVASNGKYLIAKSNGGISAAGNGSEDEAQFCPILINRPQLVLRGQYGFVGIKGASGRVECNKSRGEVFDLEPADGAYHIKAPSGQYWTVDGDGVAATSASPVVFHLEFVKRSMFMIKHAESGKYLQGEQNGGFKGTGSDQNVNTLWEY